MSHDKIVEALRKKYNEQHGPRAISLRDFLAMLDAYDHLESRLHHLRNIASDLVEAQRREKFWIDRCHAAEARANRVSELNQQQAAKLRRLKNAEKTMLRDMPDVPIS